MDTFRERFYSKVSISADPDACHIWVGTIRDKRWGGYGCIGDAKSGKQWRSHRLAYIWATGETLSDDEVIRHKCDNTRCVNPKHLLKGSHADNVADRVERNRSATGARNGRAKLTPEQVRIIFKDTRSKSHVAKEYGVDRNVIRDIQRRKKWQTVTADL